MGGLSASLGEVEEIFIRANVSTIIIYYSFLAKFLVIQIKPQNKDFERDIKKKRTIKLEIHSL